VSDTIGHIVGQRPARSMTWRQLEAIAAPQDVASWVVDEANRRQFSGAFNAKSIERPIEPSIEDELLLVALLAPHAPVDVRLWKLATRMLQSGRLDVTRLLWLAKLERATPMLFWLLSVIPAPERNESIEALARACPEPRGYQGVRIHYDANRLVRRPVTKESLWHLKRK
jgi:hypothetical protein